MGPFTTFSELLAALWRQALLILLIFAIGLPAVYWYAKTRPDLYEAVGVLGVTGPEAARTMGGRTEISVSRRLDEIQQAILSRDRVAQLVERFDLFPGASSMSLKILAARQAITLNKLVDPWRPDTTPHGLSVIVRLDDPELAADLANALLQIVMDEDQRREETRLAASLESLQSTLDYLELQEAQIGEEISVLDSRIAEYRAMHLNSLPENLATQRDQLVELEQQLAVLNQEMAVFDLGRAASSSEALTRTINQYSDRRDTLTARIAAVEAALEIAPEVERELLSLSREIQNLEVELDVIVTQRAEASMSQSLSAYVPTAQFTVLENAVPPDYRVSTSPRKVAAAGAMAVAALALGLALLRELLHPVIRTANQMRRQLDVEPIVAVPYIGPQKRRVWRSDVTPVLLGVLFAAAAVGSAVSLAVGAVAA